MYIKWQHNLNPAWSSFADIQYRHVLHDMKGFEDNPLLFIKRDFNFFNPKAGFNYNQGGWNAYFSYAMAHKEPNRDDFEASLSQQPKSETLHDFEAAIEQTHKNYNWSVTGYYMLYKDQLVLTGKINDVGNYTRINVPDSYRLGLELQGGVSLRSWLKANANLSLSRNKIKSFTEYLDEYDADFNYLGQESIEHSNTDISFSPSVVGSFSLNFLPVKNLEISLSGKYVSKQYLDNTQNNGRVLDAFFVQDLRCIYTIKKKLPKTK
jgi:iron complex outermembrane receptor protein